MENIYSTYTSPSGNTFILRKNENGTETHIPMDEGNADYQAYLNRDNPEYGKPPQL